MTIRHKRSILPLAGPNRAVGCICDDKSQANREGALAVVCPSRGTRDEPTRKQGPFEGSFRQRRAETLRLVSDEPRSLGVLDGDAVRSLERDGLVVVVDGLVALPS